jgi:cytochrome c biogenesis protein CcmG, thiol:disulfide interchange protein DsbE
MTAARVKLVGQVAALGLVAALLGLLVWKVAGGSDSKVEGLARGETPPAPAFTLDRLDREGKVTLAAYKGRAVVLNFWASWCVPCKQEAPVLEAAWKRYRDRGAVVLGIDVQDLSADARRFARQAGWTYPLARDGQGDVMNPYGVTGVPETLFVNRRGKVIARIQGPVTHEDMREQLERALA